MPHETAAVSAHVLCTPYNHAPCHFMQSHIRKVYACLATVTCHLHFWQNDRDLLRATAVTRGRNGYRHKRAQKVDTGEENSPAAPTGIRTRDLSVTSPALYPLSYLHPPSPTSPPPPPNFIDCSENLVLVLLGAEVPREEESFQFASICCPSPFNTALFYLLSVSIQYSSCSICCPSPFSTPLFYLLSVSVQYPTVLFVVRLHSVLLCSICCPSPFSTALFYLLSVSIQYSSVLFAVRLHSVLHCSICCPSPFSTALF